MRPRPRSRRQPSGGVLREALLAAGTPPERSQARGGARGGCGIIGPFAERPLWGEGPARGSGFGVQFRGAAGGLLSLSFPCVCDSVLRHHWIRSSCALQVTLAAHPYAQSGRCESSEPGPRARRTGRRARVTDGVCTRWANVGGE